MNTILERLKNNFCESIQTNINVADLLLPQVGLASEKIIQRLLEGNKILTCGNGGSACDALRFASQMLNRFKHERPSLPAIALNADVSTLTSIANDSHFNDVFARQVRALGHENDLLLVFSTTGHSMNVLNAIKAGHDRGMNVLALTGYDGGKIPSLLTDEDIEIRVPANDKARVQESHLLIIHSICDVIDFQLFGHGEMVS